MEASTLEARLSCVRALTLVSPTNGFITPGRDERVSQAARVREERHESVRDHLSRPGLEEPPAAGLYLHHNRSNRFPATTGTTPSSYHYYNCNTPLLYRE